jgi:hypothetical protein
MISRHSHYVAIKTRKMDPIYRAAQRGLLTHLRVCWSQALSSLQERPSAEQPGGEKNSRQPITATELPNVSICTGIERGGGVMAGSTRVASSVWGSPWLPDADSKSRYVMVRANAEFNELALEPATPAFGT